MLYEASTTLPAAGEVFAKHYTLCSKIGEGGQAVVFKATDNRTKTTVAVKINKHTNKGALDKEHAFFLAKDDNDHTVACLELSTERQLPYVILEWLPTDLYQMLERNPELLTVKAVKTVIRKVLLGLRSIHANGFAHRDIKPENILINTHNSNCADNWDVKLADFGMAHDCNDQPLCDTSCGTESYAAPEVLMRDDEYEPKATDIWSVGVVMFNLFTTFNPWEKALPSDPLFAAMCTQPQLYSQWLHNYCNKAVPIEFEELFVDMCHPDPAKRPTADQALGSPFFKC